MISPIVQVMLVMLLTVKYRDFGLKKYHRLLMRMAMTAVEIVITAVPVARIRLTTFRDGVSVTISGSGKRGGRRTQNNSIRCVRPYYSTPAVFLFDKSANFPL